MRPGIGILAGRENIPRGVHAAAETNHRNSLADRACPEIGLRGVCDDINLDGGLAGRAVDWVGSERSIWARVTGLSNQTKQS